MEFSWCCCHGRCRPVRSAKLVPGHLTSPRGIPLVVAEARPQGTFLDFPAWCDGQRGLKKNGLRHFVSSKICAAVLLKFLLAYVCSWLENNQSRYFLAPIRIGCSDHGGHGNSRMFQKDEFDFRGVDILSARNDHVLGPVDE